MTALLLTTFVLHLCCTGVDARQGSGHSTYVTIAGAALGLAVAAIALVGLLNGSIMPVVALLVCLAVILTPKPRFTELKAVLAQKR